MDLQEKLENKDGGANSVDTSTIDVDKSLLSNGGVKFKK